MIDFDKAFEIILTPDFEGSKTTNTTGDLGGKTRCGLTQRNYTAFRLNRSLEDQDIELADMSEIKEWYEIYGWNNAGCDKIFMSGRDKLAFVVFNCSVNRSYAKAVHMLQECLGIPMANITGHFGPITGDMVSKCDEQDIIDKYLVLLARHYYDEVNEIPNQERFLKGWLARIEHVKRVIGEN
jgi:lysozyme family protein